MESKSKTQAGIPQTEMPPIRFDEGKLRRTNRWLVVAVVVLAVAVVALGGQALVDLTGDETGPPSGIQGLTSTEVTRTVDANIAALNAHDEQAYGATWAADAVFTRGVSWTVDTVGVAAIVAALAQRPSPDPWRLERMSEVVFAPRSSSSQGGLRVFSNGPYAAHSFACVNGTDPAYTYHGIAVYRLGEDSKIVHQWVMSPSRKWVGGCY